MQQFNIGSGSDYAIDLGGGVTQTYNYTAGPESATYGLIAGSAFLGLAGCWRRRGRQLGVATA